MRIIWIYKWIRGVNNVYSFHIREKEIENYRDVIGFRLKVVEFFARHGLRLTVVAFGVSRSTIYCWRKKLQQAEGAISALAPCSKAPKRKRKREVSPQIIKFPEELRRTHPRMGKEKIKILLDEYCKSKGFCSPLASTIGRMIKERKYVNPLTQIEYFVSVN